MLWPVSNKQQCGFPSILIDFWLCYSVDMDRKNTEGNFPFPFEVIWTHLWWQWQEKTWRSEGGCHGDELHHEVGQLSWACSEWKMATQLSCRLTAASKSIYFFHLVLVNNRPPYKLWVLKTKPLTFTMTAMRLSLSVCGCVNDSWWCIIISKGLAFRAWLHNLTPCNFLKRHKPQLPEWVFVTQHP